MAPFPFIGFEDELPSYIEKREGWEMWLNRNMPAAPAVAPNSGRIRSLGNEADQTSGRMICTFGTRFHRIFPFHSLRI
jgi:hypothetical protein